nr:exonuclease V, chloroplastic [Tanacetum cinerariifolium]
MNPNSNWISGMLNDPTNQISGSSSNLNNNPGSSTQPPYNQMPYYPNVQTLFVNPDELSLFNQWKMQQQMGFSQYSQQQQQNQSTGSQPPSDHQSFNLIDETEDENEEEPIPTSKKSNRGAQSFIQISEDPKTGCDQQKDTFWDKILDMYNTEAKRRGFIERTKNKLTGKWTPMNASIQKFNQLVSETLALSGENDEDWITRVEILYKTHVARRYRFRVTDEEPEHFGDDALPRTPGLQRIAKSQRSGSNSTASSGSNPLMYQEFMKEQYELDRKAKTDVIAQESEERRIHEIPQISSSDSSLATDIPIEIVSDEEMSLIEAAFSLAFATKRTYNNSSHCLGDIEDGVKNNNTNKKIKKMNLLQRFRNKTGLFVTDITSSEWCEKQKEFFLVCGKPKASRAMKVGSARHAVLEEEVITRVEVLVRSAEEHWALKMINFIHGTNQLILDGLTRELPLIGFAEGVCVVGVIDEIQMMKSGDGPTLVETKTRSQNNLPSEPQQRNARLQLMCYKYFWDNLLAQPFPSQLFLELFSLNPDYVLSKEIREFAIQAGAPVQTLNDVLGKYQYVCSMLPGPRDQLLLRYEYQQDQSLIGENEYLYDYDWVTHQIRSSIEFWKGEREASYALENERWKCRHCMYASRCPINTVSTPQTTQET